MNRDSSTLASIAAAIVGIQVGSAIVATRFVIEQAEPASLAFLRYAIGFLCFLPFLLTSPLKSFARRDIVPILLLGITQFGIVVALLNYALQSVSSARAALIFSTFPLQTMLIAAVLKQERLTLNKSFGVLLTIVGVGLTFGEQIWSDGNGQKLTGELAVLISAFAGSLCSVLYRPYLQKYPTLQVSSFSMLASVIFLAFLSANEGFFSTWPAFTATGWAAILFIGFGSGIGYYLWLWALNRASPTKVTIFLALNPVTAAILGMIFLNEKLTYSLTIGICFVVLGLFVAHRNA